MATIQEISAEMSKLLKPVSDKIQNVDNKVDEVKNSLKTLQEKIKHNEEKHNQLENTIKAQNTKIEYLERKIMEKNLIIFGVEEENRENLPDKIIRLFQETLLIKDMPKTDIEDIRRIGTQNQNRPIKLELSNKQRKYEILKKCTNLRGTTVRIEEELPKNIVEERKKLKVHLKQAKENGYRAFLKYNKLIVNGESFTLEELETSTEQLEEHIIRINNQTRRKSISISNIPASTSEENEEIIKKKTKKKIQIKKEKRPHP